MNQELKIKLALDGASVVRSGIDDIGKSVGTLVKSLGAAFGATEFTSKLVAVQREFDILNSSLVTMTGSTENAKVAFAAIQGFAQSTPYSLQEVTQAFVKMKSLGLDASEKALTSYGNTASAMGKSLNQMIEAVADASTSEFERLKEFGIKAKQEGDSVSLTFQGVTSKIGNNAAEITQYLQGIGENQFASAMAERAKTLDGAISNLADGWDNLFLTISQNNSGGLIYDSVKLASGAVTDLTTIIKSLSAAAGENATETGAMKAVQEGIAITFETVAVLGVNVAYVIRGIGTEIGGLAAQAAAVASLDFAGAKFIGEEMKRDATAARIEVDALTERILNARTAAAEAAGPAGLGALGNAIATVASVAVDGQKKVGDFYSHLIAMHKQAAGELEALSKPQDDYAKALQSALGPLEQHAQSLEREVANYGLTESAIQATIIARLEEARQLAAENGAWDQHLDYLDREIALRKRIASASGQKEALDANANAAKKAAKDWEKASDDINRALTDALMRGFEDGKSFGQNFVDSLRNSLKTAGLKIVVNTVTGALGLSGASSASGAASGSGIGSLGQQAFTSLAAPYIGSALISGGAALGAGSAVGGFATGLGTSMASGAGTLSTFSAGASLAGTAGGGAAGAGMMIGAAMPYIAAAIALYAVLSKEGGGPKTEVYGGTRTTGWGLGRSAPTNAGIDAMVGNTVATFDSVLARFDKSATLLLGVGGSADPHGDAPSETGYTLSVDGVERTKVGHVADLNSEALATRTSQALIAALEATDINRIINGYLDSVDVGALTADQSSSIVTSILAFDTMADALDRAALGAGATSDAMFNIASVARKTTTDDKGVSTTESTIQSAARIMQETLAVADALDKLGVDIKKAFPVDGLYAMSTALASLFGGVEGFNASVSAYYTNFFSAEEKTKNAWEDMGKAFSNLNIALPTTREAFRDIVDGLDLATVGGQATFKALMDLQGGFAALTPSLEDVAKAAADAAKDLASARLDSATAAADLAMSALETAVEAQRKIYEVQVGAAEDAVSEIKSIFDTLDSSIKTLYSQADSAQQAAQGRAFIGNALSTAQATGYLPESQALSEAIQAAMNDSQVYASLADEQFAKMELAGSLSKLKAISGDQLTITEKQLKAAQDQILRLDDTLSIAKQQLDAANGINTSVLSVAEAVRNLGTALSALSATRAAQSLPTTAPSAYAQAKMTPGAYEPFSGSDSPALRDAKVAAQGGLDYSKATSKEAAAAMALYASTHGGANTAQFNAALAAIGGSFSAIGWDGSLAGTEALRKKYSFAVGTNYVPYDMTAQIHEGEAIVPKAYNPAAGGGVNNTARLESLVEGLTKEVQRLQAIVNDGNNHARRTADTLDNVTEGGSNMRTVAL